MLRERDIYSASQRTITAFEDILPTDSQPSLFDIQNNLAHLARNYGLNDMYDVAAVVLTMGKYMQLCEFTDEQGNLTYLPTLHMNVTMDNAVEIQRLLAAASIACVALTTNKEFKVLWNIEYQGHGLFGEMWSNRYLRFSRDTTDPQVYMSLFDVYTDQLDNVQKWHIQMMTAF